MPKYYCDYCDTFLTHDSVSVYAVVKLNELNIGENNGDLNFCILVAFERS